MLPVLLPQHEVQQVPPEAPLTGGEAGTLRGLMRAVVTTGSGRFLQDVPGEIGAKTGTAEYGDSGAAHAWFTGFAPADDPQIAVAVIVESATDNWTGETGGRVAAPIAQAMLEAGVSP